MVMFPALYNYMCRTLLDSHWWLPMPCLLSFFFLLYSVAVGPYPYMYNLAYNNSIKSFSSREFCFIVITEVTPPS